MKKLLFSSLLVAFAVAAQAGDVKVTSTSKDAKETSACCASKAVTKSSCSAGEKMACSKDAPSKRALLSPKAAGESTKRL